MMGLLDGLYFVELVLVVGWVGGLCEFELGSFIPSGDVSEYFLIDTFHVKVLYALLLVLPQLET